MQDRIFIGRQLVDELPRIIRSAQVSIRLSMYQLSVASAHSHIAIQRVWRELEQAPARGIACFAILAKGSALLPGAQAASRCGAMLAKAGWSVCMAPQGKLMHAKCLVVDLQFVIAGSHNWTSAGLMMNTEMSILTTARKSVEDAHQWQQKQYDENIGKTS